MFNFENFLNAMRGNYKGEMPSMKEMLTGNYKGEMPSMKEMLTGNYKGEMPSMKEMLTGNSAYINQSIPGMNMGNELGVVTAQGQGQGNFNIMNPFTYGNMKKAVEGTRAGDENIQYSDSPAGQVGEAANERNRLLKQLLEGS
jgi:hypothetical protein